MYLEADPDQTYFCTCYGVADVAAVNDPASKETVAAKHHDKPLYILPNEQSGRNIRPAPFVNHTDQELMLVETLVSSMNTSRFGSSLGCRRCRALRSAATSGRSCSAACRACRRLSLACRITISR